MSYRSGVVAFLGKPNVGKSTLVNALVGKKVSIVSSKPQTTRKRALGIVTGEGFQFGILDTPGLHSPTTRLGKAMVEQARAALDDANAAVAVVDASRDPDELDSGLAKLLRAEFADRGLLILCMNKADRLKPHDVVRRVEAYQALFGTERTMLTSAIKCHNLDKLASMIAQSLPEAEPLFGEDEFTDQPARFMAAELIRERVLELTKQEVPHATAVRVDQWDESDPAVLRIAATIYVEKPGQKAIVIGKHGAMIKRIGSEARAGIEELLGQHVFLDLHVSVRGDWRMNVSRLQDLDYL
jgi:GTP-binding protein Era